MYKRQHKDWVRRCLAVIELDRKLRALDLTVPGVAEKIGGATNLALIEAVFEADGMDY